MNLKGIIAEIDKALVAQVPLQPTKAFGLAEFYYDGDKKYPGVVNGTEVTNCLLDDSYQVSWYHRSESTDYRVIENNYGDKMDKVEEITPVNLIIYARRSKPLQVIKDIFASALPSVLSKLVCESLMLFDCTIELKGAEMNTTLVFKDECTVPDVRVGIEHGLIAIRYDIKSTYRRGCETICEC